MDATPRSPVAARRLADRLLERHSDRERRAARIAADIEKHAKRLAIAEQVTGALKQLSEQLFQQVLSLVEEKLTIALQEILDQPIRFHADADFKRGAAAVEFWIERDGNPEDGFKGQGGSVVNILSVGLRMFALTTLDESRHRRFLVLDEQDCWLRPELVPKLVKIVHQAGKALGFQVLMISHHDLAIFEPFADKIYQLAPDGDGAVRVAQVWPAE